MSDQKKRGRPSEGRTVRITINLTPEEAAFLATLDRMPTRAISALIKSAALNRNSAAENQTPAPAAPRPLIERRTNEQDMAALEAQVARMIATPETERRRRR